MNVAARLILGGGCCSQSVGIYRQLDIVPARVIPSGASAPSWWVGYTQ